METDRGEASGLGEGRFCSRRWKFCRWLGTGMGRERPAGRTSPSLSTMKRTKRAAAHQQQTQEHCTSCLTPAALT